MANQYEQNRDNNQQGSTEQQQNRNAGNFKNDPERAREAGKKGGQSSGRSRSE